MNVIIGIDPHKATHHVVAVSDDEHELAQVSVRACRTQTSWLVSWAEPFPTRTWAIEGADGLGLRRSIEVHHLYYSLPVWYALAWDRLRSDIRSFRIDRIASASVTAESFRLRPPDQFLDAVESGTHHM